jgi:hypothetical protein
MDAFGMVTIVETRGLLLIRNTGRRKEEETLNMINR